MFHKSGTAICALMSTQPLADAQHHERHQKHRQQCSSVTHCARAYVSEPHHESAPTQPQTGRSPQAPRQRAHVVRDAIQDHELDRPRQCASLLVVGQLNDLTAVDTEDHLLPTRQRDDEFQLFARRMHQLDNHIALDLGNFSVEIATQEIEAQRVESSQ